MRMRSAAEPCPVHRTFLYCAGRDDPAKLVCKPAFWVAYVRHVLPLILQRLRYAKLPFCIEFLEGP